MNWMSTTVIFPLGASLDKKEQLASELPNGSNVEDSDPEMSSVDNSVEPKLEMAEMGNQVQAAQEVPGHQIRATE